MPHSCVTIGRCIIPFGGLLRGRLAAGETLVVNGATGAYGTAAVLLGVAMGAVRVIAAGRNRDALEAVAQRRRAARCAGGADGQAAERCGRAPRSRPAAARIWRSTWWGRHAIRTRRWQDFTACAAAVGWC